MAYVDMAYIVMAYVVMAYIVMARSTCGEAVGVYSYGLDSDGLYSYGLNSYGLCRYAIHSYGPGHLWGKPLAREWENSWGLQTAQMSARHLEQPTALPSVML
jgi:alpha-tubulin suppressor-like RCC1 family protein